MQPKWFSMSVGEGLQEGFNQSTFASNSGVTWVILLIKREGIVIRLELTCEGREENVLGV